MAAMVGIDTEKLITCPYNSLHCFKASKMVFHMPKCPDAVGYKDKKIPCPFNATHLFYGKELGEHIMQCSDVIHLMPHAEEFITDTGLSGNLEKPAIPTSDMISHDWEDEWNEPRDNVGSKGGSGSLAGIGRGRPVQSGRREFPSSFGARFPSKPEASTEVKPVKKIRGANRKREYN